MSEWPMVRFEDLADKSKSAFSKPYGSAIMKADYLSQGVPIVRGANLRKGIFLDDEFVFISEDQADRMPGANLTSGDLIFTHRGTIGQVSMIPRSRRFNRYVLSTANVKARLDPSRALPEFYYYYFSSPLGQNELLKNVSTVGVPGLAQPVATIKSLMVPHPTLPVQKAIVDVLVALDGKIAVNDRIAGRCNELSIAYFQSAITGASEAPLSEAVLPILGGTPDRSVVEYWGTGNPWASARDVTGAPFGILVSTEEEITDRAVTETKAKPIPKGSVILTARGTVGVVARVGQPTSFNQSCYAFIPGQLPAAVLYLTVQAAAQRMLAMAHGTVFSTVTMKTFEHIYIPELGSSQAQHLENQVSPLLDSVECRVRESLSLGELRDTLLPRLMSGEIRVRDAEKVVEDVT
jgi:type I restriction enzyme S subunit